MAITAQNLATFAALPAISYLLPLYVHFGVVACKNTGVDMRC